MTSIELHIQRYTKYIYEDLSTIDIDTATYKEHLHKSFEWFACIQLSRQYQSIFLRWEDVQPQLREEKDMPRDMGIDAWDIEGNRVSQMKLYQGCITWRHFATFLGCCYKFKDVVKILYRTHESQLCHIIQSFVDDKTIMDHTIPGMDFRVECKRIQSLTFPSSKLPETYAVRPYQMESIAYLEKGRDSNKNVYLCIPTGCGKTVIILHYHLTYPTETMLVLVPRIVLMEQWGEECVKLGIKPYLVGTGAHHTMDQYDGESIVICVYDSFPAIYGNMDLFHRYCIDEAHHVKTPERYMDTELEHDIVVDSDDSEDDSEEEMTQMTYMECIQSLSDTNKTVYISATLDPPNDGSLFYEYKVRQAIEEGFLCDYQFVCPIFEQEYVTNEHLARYLVHKQHESHCVIYASSCKEGKEFTAFLNQLRKGCAGYIDADTPPKRRKKLFAEFETGTLQFLVNVRILVEGYNAPHIRSIFFLRVSSSDIFIIQAIGRALRLHQDKLLATIYIPFTYEDDLERIQTFLHQLSSYDERVKQTISQKKMGGYLSIEHGEEASEEDEEEKEDTMDVFEFRYNLVVDRMGNSNQLEEMAVKKALEYKAFYENRERKPSQVLNGKTKERKDNATKEQKHECKLAVWFSNMKQAKQGKGNMVLYPSIEKILVELLGSDWYENRDLEGDALEIALQFKTFYEEKQRYPSDILKTKEKKDNATEEQKYEQKLAVWFGNVKTAKKGKRKGSGNVLYSSVEKILIELLGELWYENKDLEGESLKIALEFKTFYEEKQRYPSLVLQNKTKEKKENATEEQKHEHKLTAWFGHVKRAKKGKGSSVLYPSVEKILIELLGELWYENRDLEGEALKIAVEFKTFYQQTQRKPSHVLQGKTKNNVTEEQKYEHKLAQWFGCMKKAKQGKGGHILYPSVEKILIELLGESWYENKDLEGEALKIALEFKTFYEEHQRKPSQVLVGKTKEKKENATEEQKYEQMLARWFSNMKTAKQGKSRQILYPSVEKILVELLGVNWCSSLEAEALKIALNYKTFYEEHQRKPSQVLQTKEKKENATEEQKHEHKLAQWFGCMKKAKQGKGNGNVLYSSVEKLLIETLGSVWFT